MNLAQVITATDAMDNSVRQTAENQLLQARNQSPALFILACSEEFIQNNLTDKLRPKAAILIKYALLNNEEGADKLWYGLDSETRQKTKLNILGALAYPNDTIRNVSADLISIIYSIEYLQNDWTDLIDNLTKNTNNANADIKKSAILALGKICDQFKIKKITMQKDAANLVLGGIYYGMQQQEPDDIKAIAVKALSDSLGFVRELFQAQNVRQEVVKLLLQTMVSSNRKVQTFALQCMIEFVRIYYDFLGEIFAAIWEATSGLIVCSDKEMAIYAIEIWNTIANEDKERNSSSGRSNAYSDKCLNVIAEVDKVLVPALLENLLNGAKYEDDDEGGEHNIISSTKNCLCTIAEATKDRYLDYAIKFVGNYLVSQSNLELRAALITYYSMLEGPSPQSLGALILKALPTITILLTSSQNLHVQVAAASALERTAEILPEAYFQEPLFSQIAEQITLAIGSHPRISMHITKLWHHLGEFVNKKQSTNFKLDFSTVIDTLLKNSFRDLDKAYFILIDHSLLAVMTLLLCTSQDNIKSRYVHTLVECFKKTGEVSGERRDLIQAGLLACLQTLLHKYQFSNQDPVIDDIFNLIIEMFKAYQSVTADGIYVLGALASSMGGAFKGYSEKVWPFVAEGFKLYDQPELFIATLNAIVELAGACPEEAVNYLGNIFENLVNLLNEKSYDKALKLRIIISIGDIALGCRELILPYIEKLVRMYEMAMNAALSPPAEATPDMVEYLEQLRENLLESYTCFFHSVTESPNPESILESLPNVMHFLERTCTKEFDPTVDYMRNSLNLVADIGLIFKGNAERFINTQLTRDLIAVMEKHQNNQDNLNTLEYTKKVINQLKLQ